MKTIFFILALSFSFTCFAEDIKNVECQQTVLAKDTVVGSGYVKYRIWATESLNSKEYREYNVDPVIYDKYNIDDVGCFTPKSEEGTSLYAILFLFWCVGALIGLIMLNRPLR